MKIKRKYQHSETLKWYVQVESDDNRVELKFDHDPDDKEVAEVLARIKVPESDDTQGRIDELEAELVELRRELDVVNIK